VFALWLKENEAEEYAYEVAMGHRQCGIRGLRVMIHRGMKNRYYLSRWKRRESESSVKIDFVTSTASFKLE